MMLNLPSFSGEIVIFILLADFLLMVSAWVAFGGIFTFSRDLTGRPIDVSIGRKIIASLLLVAMLAYLALQIVLFSRFLPYWSDRGTTATEVVSAKSIARDDAGQPVAYWLTTQTHRFGVSPEIYDGFKVGDTVTVTFRAADDTLYTIELLTAPRPTSSP